MSRPPRRPSRALWALAAALTLLAPQPSVVRSDEAVAGAGGDAVPSLPITFGGPFQLVDHAGRPRTDADFRGRFMLIYFGYTYCPDVCPLGLAAMADALGRLGDGAERVQPIFITVDPARDTAEQLADYVGHFHPRLVGLTGSEAQVRAAAKAYRVHRRKVPLPDASGGGDGYLVDHGSITYLMGPGGGFVTLFPHGTDPAFMADAIRRYLD